MFDSATTVGGFAAKKVAAGAAIVVLGGALGGYAIHEHNAAANLEAKNRQTTAALDQSRQQMQDLSSKVNVLVARAEAAQAAAAAPAATRSRATKPRATVRREDPRFKKLQAQLDAQGKAIDDTRTQIASTQGDLANTRTELSGSIAHTHDELVLLQKRGERNYTEFDLSKSKQFERKGPFSLRLKKANDKHQYADMELIVDDRNLTQKHVNLYQPVMFYTPDSPQPVEVVINNISKDHVHGYVSASKYRQSELTSMASTQSGATASADQSNPPSQPPSRQKLPVPQPQ